MPRIINTFANENPLAKAISGLGNSLFGDTLTPAVKRQELRDKQREEMGIEEMARIFGGATNGQIDINRAGEFGILGGMKPEDAAMWNVFLTGNKLGPRNSLTTNAMAGAGKYKDAAENLDLDRSNAFNMNAADNTTSRANNAATNATTLQANAADNAESRYQFNQKPIDALIDGQPGFAPQGQVTRQVAGPHGTSYQPIPTQAQKTLTQEFQEALAAAKVALPEGTPEQQRNWAIEQISKSRNKFSVTLQDGTVISDESGPSVGQLTPANATKVQADLMSIDAFGETAKRIDKILTDSSHAVGASGNILHGIQSASILATELARASGFKNIEDAWISTQAHAIAMGVKPETMSFKYDPAFSEVETLYNIFAFQGMRAIGGQSGNDQSNRDFQVIKEMLGDPTEWTTNAKDLQTKMRVAQEYVAFRRKQARSALGLPPETAPATTGGTTTSKGVPWKVIQ